MNIYCCNIPFDITKERLEQIFSEHGGVSRVSIIMDRETGRSRGFAFVEMPNHEHALSAIEYLNDQEIDGRRFIVKEANPRPEHTSRGGFSNEQQGYRKGGNGGKNRR